MALIDKEKFNRVDKTRNSIHKPTVGTYTVFEEDGQRYFQIDTYGTAERAMPEKISQSIQMDRSMAEELIEILQHELLLD